MINIFRGRNLLILFAIIQALSCQSIARPVFLLSMREDQNIYVGLEYDDLSAQVSIFKGSLQIGDEGFAPQLDNAKNLISLSKSFQHEDFKTGIEWLGGFALYDPMGQIDNSVGYFVGKEFGNVRIIAGPYLNVSYKRNNGGVSPTEDHILAIHPFLSLGFFVLI